VAVEHLTQRELAVRLGLATRQIRRLVDDGLPRDRKGPGHPTYPWPEANHWYIEYRERLAVQKLQPNSWEDARARRETAMARLAELEVAEKEGQLIPMDVLRETLGDVVDRVRAKLIRIPGAWAPQLTGLDSPREVVKVLHSAVGEAIEELGQVQLLDDEEDEDLDEEEDDDASDD